MSSKQAVQQAHHRMDGRPYGKLLPRYAGPILEFRLTHPDASRADLIHFIDATFGVRVSRIALYHFLKKFGLDIPALPSWQQALRRRGTTPLPVMPAAASCSPLFFGSTQYAGAFLLLARPLAG